MIRLILLCIPLLILPNSLSAQVQPYQKINIVVGAISAQLKVIKKNLQQAKNCKQGEKPNKKWDRVSLDFFILCKALNLGGITPEFSFLEYPNYKRLYLESIKGKVTMPVESI
jgi:hypothetical protein